MTDAVGVASSGSRFRVWLGTLLLVAGLCGHLLAARAIGGSFTAYIHHIFGFFLLTAVAGAILLLLGSRFWKGHTDITLLLLGALQAIFGVLVYLHPI